MNDFITIFRTFDYVVLISHNMRKFFGEWFMERCISYWKYRNIFSK